MLLRRHTRTPDYAPQVNGKPVIQEPKKKKLTEKKTATSMYTTVPNVNYTPNHK